MRKFMVERFKEYEPQSLADFINKNNIKQKDIQKINHGFNYITLFYWRTETK